jgi:hypothetical protein
LKVEGGSDFELCQGDGHGGRATALAALAGGRLGAAAGDREDEEAEEKGGAKDTSLHLNAPLCKRRRESFRVVKSNLSIPLDIRVAAEAGSSSAHLQCKEYAVNVSLADHTSDELHHAAITMV